MRSWFMRRMIAEARTAVIVHPSSSHLARNVYVPNSRFHVFVDATRRGETVRLGLRRTLRDYKVLSVKLRRKPAREN